MHFVDKKSDTDYKEVVSILAEYSKQEMPRWIKFQNKERTEFKRFWTEPEIREPLSELFLNCCGYCGGKLAKNNRNLERILKKAKFKKKAEKESAKLRKYKEQASFQLLIKETISKFNNKNNTHI